MTAIETEKLRIRNFRNEDWEALYIIIQQYRASSLAVYDHAWPAAQEEYPKIAGWFAAGDSYWAVCLKESGRLIGFVCLNPEKKEGKHEYNLGYTFGPGYRGKGYATEACGAALSHAFTRLEADAVVTGTAEANEASCRLLARLGFTVTGRSKESFQRTPEGKPIEFTGVKYAISRAEWKEAQARPNAGVPG